MILRIKTSYKGIEQGHEFATGELSIGRLHQGEPGLNLSADACVSRGEHAVIKVRDGVAWILDRHSTYGTKVNGEEVRGKGERALSPGDVVVLGETTLWVTVGSVGACAPLPPDPSAPEVHIMSIMRTGKPMAAAMPGTASDNEKRLAVLLDLPAQLSAQMELDALWQLIMERVVAVIPSAKRGALLLCDPEQDTFLLKAYVSQSEPSVSQTLARRALTEHCGFIWRGGPTSRSIRERQIAQGMYAPLEWQGQVFGVICVDSPVTTDSFHEPDLQFLFTIGHYTAMVLAARQLREELARSQQLRDRLLANFSARVRTRLVQHAALGKLRPGGNKSRLTVLFCDICGFTTRAAQMDAQDVAHMLNDYFPALVRVILDHEGTVDKFAGDAILAVFGGPEPDPDQHEHALAAAFGLLTAVREVSQRRLDCGDVTCQVRIGLDTGEVFHGFIGGADFLQFTVIGNTVNRASRYCAAARPGEILVSAELFQRAYHMVRMEKVSVQTKEGEILGYRVLASSGEPGPNPEAGSAAPAAA